MDPARWDIAGSTDKGRLRSTQCMDLPCAKHHVALFRTFEPGPCTFFAVMTQHPLHTVQFIYKRGHLDGLKIGRDQFIHEMKARNIGTSVHFIPVHLHPYYRDRYGWKPDDFPIANREYYQQVSIPLHPRLSNDETDDVIRAVLDIVEIFRR